MSSVTLQPTSDFLIESAVTKNGYSGTTAAALSDASDTTFPSFSSTGSNTRIFVTLGALPGNVIAISAAQVVLRAKQAATKSQSFMGARIYKSDGTTGLTNFVSGTTGNPFAPTGSFTNLTATMSGVDTTLADWSGAILEFQGQNDGNSNTFDVSEASVILTVTLASSPPNTPTNLVATFGGLSGVALSWTASTGSPTDYVVQSSPDNSTWTTYDTLSTATSYTVTGLTPGTRYFFQVKATNSGGSSSYTSSVIWVAGANFCVPVSQSSDDAIQNTGTSGVTLTDATGILGVSTMAGLRFPSAGLAANALIGNGYVNLYATASASGIYPFDCQLSTSAATFAASSNNISSRTLTGNSASFNAGVVTSAGFFNSANIAQSLQALVNQGSWTTSDAVVVVIGQGGAPNLAIEMFDGNPAQAAVLWGTLGGPADMPNGVVGAGVQYGGLVAPGCFTVQSAGRRASVW